MCLLVGVGNAWAQVSTAVATDGKSYILAAYSNGKYYALPQITTATTYSGTEVTVGADGKVASKTGLPLWTLTVNPSNATQFYLSYKNGTKTYHLYKNGTGATNYNIKGSESDMNYWTFTKSSDGKYYNVVAVGRGSNHTYLNYYYDKFQVRGTSHSVTDNNNTSIILLEVGASSEQFSYSIDKIGEGQILFKTAKGDEVKPGDKIDDGTVISPTFTPADGYEFTSWEYYTSMGAWQKITASTFTISKDVKFRVTFTATAPKAKYPVTIETAENGTLTIKDGETIVNNGDEVEEGKTLTVVVEPADGYRLKNWGYKDGDAAWVGNNTSTFTHVMPSAACSFKATFEEIPTYTVAFSVNGAIKQTNTYEEGATVTAPTVDDINGKTFVGWVKTSTVDAENSPTYETISKATETVTYYAVFATVDGDAAEIWSKVTNSASLVAGDVITFVSSTAVDYNKPGTKDKVSGYVAISSQNTSNWKGVGVTIENDVLTTTENVKQFTLTATDSDEYPWAFCYDNNYLYASSNSSNQLKSTSDLNTVGAKFSLVISEGKATLTANREGRNTLQVNGSYNSGSATANPIFSCYSSTSTNTEPAIYKKEGGVSYSDYTTTPASTVPTFASLEELLKAENLEDGAVVTVSFDNEIFYLSYDEEEESATVVLNEGENFVGLMAYGAYGDNWQEGGRLSGTWENVYYAKQLGNVYLMSYSETPWKLNYADPATATISLNAACHDEAGMVYGTYSCSSAWVVPADLIVSEISIIDGLLYVESYQEGDVVPANTGVMVSATDGGDYKVVIASELMSMFAESVLGDDNCLRPSGDDGITAGAMANADPNSIYYRLTMQGGTKIGYWWGAAEGAAFNLAANKAYLVVSKDVAAKAIGLWVNDDATLIEAINNSKDLKSVKYNIAGQRVANDFKGIVIVNGKKLFNK